MGQRDRENAISKVVQLEMRFVLIPETCEQFPNCLAKVTQISSTATATASAPSPAPVPVPTDSLINSSQSRCSSCSSRNERRGSSLKHELNCQL